MPDLIDDRLHHLAGILNQADEGKQDLTIGLAELLDDGGRLWRGAGHHMIRFLHGGRLLSVFLRLATGFYRTGTDRRLPTFNYDRDALERDDFSHMDNAHAGPRKRARGHDGPA